MIQEERKYWDPEVETLPLDKLNRLQDERLQELVALAYEKTPFYRHKFDAAGIKPSDIKGVADITKLPLIEDTDTRGIPLLEKLTIPMEQVKMFHSTSGTTTGIPEPCAFSQKGLDAFFYMESRGRWTMGVRPWDVVQVLTQFDCCLHGYRNLGATVVMMSAGRYILDSQISLTQSAGVTVIEYMPSLLLKYFERARELGFDIKKSKVRLISGVGEGWAESYKRKIEAQYGFPFMTLWGSVELCVAAAECEAREGMHILSDMVIVEVIDSETLKPLPPGEEGELVVTLLWSDAQPVIRYRIGDISKILPYEPCPCGRTLPKMSMVKGRASQMIMIKGKKIMPIDVEEVVASTEGLTNEYQIIKDKPDLERLKVKIEHEPQVQDLRALKEKVEENLYNELNIGSEVELVPPGSIQRVAFKAQRVIKTY